MNTDTMTKVEAIALIDKAIDYIDTHGFDIRVYRRNGGGAGGACCYIGTLRTVAGCHPEPVNDDGSMCGPPALRTALNVLDHLAIPLLRIAWRLRYEQEYRCATGRAIESLGFQERYAAEEQKNAIKMLRLAKETLAKELDEEAQIVLTPVEELITV